MFVGTCLPRTFLRVRFLSFEHRISAGNASSGLRKGSTMDPKHDAALHATMHALAAREHSVFSNFYESGGYGMYPTTVFGFALLVLACLYCFRPERKYLPFVV